MPIYSRLSTLLLLVLEIGEIPRILSYHANLCVGKIGQEGQPTSLGSAAWDVYRSDKYALASITNSDPVDMHKGIVHKLTVYPIMYKSGDVNDGENSLFGWFHVKIKIDTTGDGTKGMSLLIIQPWASKVATYIPGDFVATRFVNECREDFGPGFNHSDYVRALSPCFFAPLEATAVPRTILYTENGTGKDIGDSKYTFRTDFPECGLINEESPFQFRIYTSHRLKSSTNKPPLNEVYRTNIFFSNDVYGGYDPEPPKMVAVTCEKEADTSVHWIKKAEEDSSVQPLINNDCYAQFGNGDLNRFQGRCSALTSGVGVGAGMIYGCTNRANHTKDYPNNTEVIIDPTTGCKACEKAKNITRDYGMTASSAIGLYVWAYRITHGIAMSIGTMFVIPVGAVFARYFKETHMSHRIMGLHVWYGVHISSGMTGFSVLLSGLVAGTVARAFFGFSKHPGAYIHVALGWISIVVYLFALCIAPFRMYLMSQRVFSILAHFIFGWACRILWGVCLLTSFYIPGSPAARKDIHMHPGVELDMFIVLAWIIVDIVVHAFLQLRMKKLEEDYPRRYAFAVPIPIVRPSLEVETPDTKVRNIAIIVYEVISLLCAVVLSLLMCYRDPSGRYFGKMSHTHSPSGKLNNLFTDMLYNDDDG